MSALRCGLALCVKRTTAAGPPCSRTGCACIFASCHCNSAASEALGAADIWGLPARSCSCFLESSSWMAAAASVSRPLPMRESALQRGWPARHSSPAVSAGVDVPAACAGIPAHTSLPNNSARAQLPLSGKLAWVGCATSLCSRACRGASVSHHVAVPGTPGGLCVAIVRISAGLSWESFTVPPVG
eukprot:352850-Chlamydomonas_euryale.AAC.7